MLVASFAVLLAAPLFATQDMFVSNYFLYRDDNDTINEAFSFRLEKRVVERTKLKIAYLHANIKYYKVPMWNERLRRRVWLCSLANSHLHGTRVWPSWPATH